MSDIELDKEMRKFWAFEGQHEPRINQCIALNFLKKNKRKKYLFVEAPVGCGKSAVSMTFSRYMGNNSFILTPQTILQKQYENDFLSDKKINLSSLYGKSHYKCQSKGGVSCATGSIIKPRCISCPYADARETAKKSNNTVMNYALGLSVWSYTSMFKKDDRILKRNLMTCDEAHSLDSILCGFDSIHITKKWCSDHYIELPKQRDLEIVVNFIRDVYNPALIEAYDILLTEIESTREHNPSDNAQEIKKVRELQHVESQLNICEEFLRIDISDVIDDYVLIDSDFGIQIKRISAHRSFKRLIEPMADQFLFMSSTFLGKEATCADLGIDPNEAAYISIESEFDPDNRPVVYMPQMKMNYKWRDNNQKTQMLKTIETLAEMHEGENGIIHTGNFAIADWLVDNLSCKGHRIIEHGPESGVSRNQAIAEFMDESTTPAILISPSSTEGLDLKYDLGRFAIFCKVPFGNMGDAWIKKRMELSPEWYQRQALIEIIQGGGRVVRADDDEGRVYILDESFGYLYSQNKDIMPQWWKDGYQTL